MKIVLYQPQIPQNTGNIVRTCAVTGTELILVEPLGFSIKDRWLKRAGLDYWNLSPIESIGSLEEYLAHCEAPFYFLSSHATKTYSNIPFTTDTHLIFGSEDSGLPKELTSQWPEKFYTIPQRPETRCLNLATAVGIVLYEGLRQQKFDFV